MTTAKVFKTNSTDFLEVIIQLYVEAFGKGFSSQHIDAAELHLYIKSILEKGYAIISSENEVVSGVLLVCPLSMDKYLPESISSQYEPENCLYIAEMMVSESSRGKGIGRKLMEAFETTADKMRYKDAFIRVWDENLPALALYRKMGYTDIAQIEQTKQKADNEDTFVMKKIYLHKKIV